MPGNCDRTLMHTFDRREIHALVSLLEDDNEIVQKQVAARLRELGPDAARMVETEAEAAEEKSRERARLLLESIRHTDLIDALDELAAAPEFDLESGAILLARTAYPDLDADAVRAHLDDIAASVRAELPAADTTRRTVERFARVLYGDDGLQGNAENYYDFDNTFVNRVLERRRGIPISLSAVGLFVARRVDLPIVGIGMPAHFLLAWRGSGQEILFDPFNRGRVLTREECRFTVERSGVAWRDEYLAAADSRTIMVRMIANLVGIARHGGDATRTNLYTRMAAVLEHDDSPDALPG